MGFSFDFAWNAACSLTGMLPTHARDPETYRIIGAAMAVHRELGHGFLEKVYKLALPIEFERRGILYAPEVRLPIAYKGITLATDYHVDFICDGNIIVEVKAAASLTSGDEGQLLNYLKAAKSRRGLLINFGAPSLEYRRRVWGYEEPAGRPKAAGQDE
jgi:GxxExxY protein